MKKSVFKYLSGFLLLTLFLVTGIMPGMSRLFAGEQAITCELAGQPENQSPEPVRESESNEFLVDTTAGTITPEGLFSISTLTGQHESFFIQKVYLSIPTPPPDIVS